MSKWQREISSNFYISCNTVNFQGPVVESLDNAIQRINRCPADK